MIRNGLTNLYTRDMATALGFYRNVLGFTETFHVPDEQPEHVELSAEGIHIALSSTEAATTHQGITAAPGQPAMCLVLWVDDLDQTFTKLTAAGSPVVSPPHAAGNGNRNALLKDPDGNLVELVTKAAPGADA